MGVPGVTTRAVSRPKNTGAIFVHSSGMSIELWVYISFYVLLYASKYC